MNYINNPLNMCCCGFSEMDNIRVERRTVLVDAVSNKVCELGDVTLGHTYDDVYKVTKVDRKDYGSADMRHFEVGGA